MMPSGGTQYKAHQQGRIQGLSLIRTFNLDQNIKGIMADSL